MEDRRETRLDVGDAVAMHVFDHLVGDALERLGRLHHAGRVRESLEVEREAAPLRAAMKPPGEIARISGGEVFVPLFLRQFDDGLRPQAAVEVIVQQHLGQRSNQLLVDFHERRRESQGFEYLLRGSLPTMCATSLLFSLQMYSISSSLC